MTVDDRDVGVEVEQHAVHPPGDETVECRQPRLQPAQRRPGQRPHDLHGQRGDVEVGRHGAGGCRDAGDAVTVHDETLHRAVEAQVDAERTQVLDPRIDPRLVGRAVEHTIGATADAGHVEQQLGEDQAAGAGADLPRPRRDQRACEPVGEELLEGDRAALSADELPPALLLPLLVAPLVAAREQRQQPLHQHRLLADRDAERRRPLEQEPADDPEVVERRRAVGRADHLVTAAGPGDHHPGRRRQPVEHGAIGGRDPAHRVGDVSIEAREEAEAVLGRQVGATVHPRARHRQAPRLAPGNRPALEHHHVEPTLGQLVGGGQPGHAAAQHRHLRHGRKLLGRRSPRDRRTSCDARAPCRQMCDSGTVTYRVRFLGPAALAVRVATALADADGVDLISSEPPSNRDENTVQLDLAVQGAPDAVAAAVESIRSGMPKGASIEIVED